MKKITIAIDGFSSCGKSTTNKELLNETLETKGGVNLPIAVSVAFAFLVVNYLPMFLM